MITATNIVENCNPRYSLHTMHARFCFPALLITAFALPVLFATACLSYPAAGVQHIREVEITAPNITPEMDGYRIAFVSDIHYGNNFSRSRLIKLFTALNSSHVDCIIIGGDNVFGTRRIREFAREAAFLSAQDGVYAVLGNHDFYTGRALTIRTLRTAGIVVLDETAIMLPNGITLAGINDFRDVFPPMKRFLDIIPTDGFTILVSHNPDFAEKIDLSVFDLMVSGHTHGGQITFFGWAPVIPSGYGQKYRTGTVLKDGTPVVISNGAGYGGQLLKFRLGAPSDFIIITVRYIDRH